MVTLSTIHADERSHNIAFVGSTLPARYLLENANQEGIKEIILSSDIFLNSYQYLQSIIPGIKISVQPKRYIFRMFYLAFLVVLAKMFHRKIYIFHEACWPMLDLIILLLAPKGCFMPIANLGSFIKLSHTEFASYLEQMSVSTIGKIIQNRYFDMYKHRSDGGSSWVYVLVCKHYPRSIVEVKYFGKNIMSTPDGDISALAESPARQKSILFLIGREPVDDSYISGIYLQLFSIAVKHGYLVSVKDHPNKSARLDIKCDKCTMLPPSMPAELIENNFDIVVGVASASLSFINGRVISVIRMLKEMPSEDMKIREEYLRSISNNIMFMENEESFSSFIKALTN